MRITLLQKPGPVSREDFCANLGSALFELKGKLSASIALAGFSERGWARVDVEGDDQEILQELISREFGQAQMDISNIEKYGNYQGIVVGEFGGNLEVDIGVENSRPAKVKIKLSSMRAQLADGRPLSGKEIVEHYCLFPSSKTRVRVTRLEQEAGIIEGWFSDSQIDLFSEWITTRLDRIQAYHCFRQQIESAIHKAKLERDVIATEPMTLTTHSVLCKLGTDAIGLIPKLGSILRKCELKPFLPSRILARCRQW